MEEIKHHRTNGPHRVFIVECVSHVMKSAKHLCHRYYFKYASMYISYYYNVCNYPYAAHTENTGYRPAMFLYQDTFLFCKGVIDSIHCTRLIRCKEDCKLVFASKVNDRMSRYVSMLTDFKHAHLQSQKQLDRTPKPLVEK